MPSLKTLLFLFIPAIIIACFTLFIRVIQYQPLYPKIENYDKLNTHESLTIPIYLEDPIIGDKKAGKTIIAFEDFACEGCKIQSIILDQLLQKNPGKLKIIWKGLPVNQFPYPSELAHKYAFCANEQEKFIEFQKLAFTNGDNLSAEILDIIISQLDIKESKFKTCLESNDPQKHITQTEQLGMVLNIQSVPTFFMNNKQIETPTNIEGWETLLKL
jgi:protein-disulfide isomerase